MTTGSDQALTVLTGISGCPGVYYYTIDFVQTGSSVKGTGTPYTVDDGVASGAKITFTVKGSRGYTARFEMTMAKRGSWTPAPA